MKFVNISHINNTNFEALNSEAKEIRFMISMQKKNSVLEIQCLRDTAQPITQPSSSNFIMLFCFYQTSVTTGLCFLYRLPQPALLHMYLREVLMGISVPNAEAISRGPPGHFVSRIAIPGPTWAIRWGSSTTDRGLSEVCVSGGHCGGRGGPDWTGAWPDRRLVGGTVALGTEAVESPQEGGSFYQPWVQTW